MRPLPPLAFLLCASLSARDASAQAAAHQYWEFEAPIHAFRGNAIEPGLGFQVCRLGDVDQDGADDLLFSIPWSHRGRRFGGAARVISLATGAELYSVQGSVPDLYFANRIGAGGDVDGDGIPDWLAGATQRQLTLHSGVDGSQLHSWVLPSGASDVTILGDVDGDGTNDVLVGMKDEITTNGRSGSAEVRSGQGGALIRRHLGEVSYGGFGRTVLSLGDLDGDGRADYAIAAQRSAIGDKGLVSVYSGASGQALYTLQPTDGDARVFGSSMDLIEDLDGDGVRDLGVLDTDAFFGRLGRLHVVSGATGTELYTVDGSEAGRLLRVAGDLGDLDNDGLGEWLLLIRYNYRQGVEVRSGADGAVLRRYHGPLNYEDLGSITGVGDVDGDGVPDFAASNNALTTVDVASTAPRTYLEVCEGELNSRGLRASLSFTQANSIERNALRFQIRQGARNRVAVLFYGPGRTRTPFGQGTLCVEGRRFRMERVLLNHSGNASGTLDLSNTGLNNGEGTILPGSTWVFQAWYRDGDDPGAFNLTSAVSVPFRD